jgi:hemolysin activation/secretion protein
LIDQDDAERGDEINITAASTELSRTTNTKTEALKERIGAKKEAKKEDQNKPDPSPTQAPYPTQTVEAELQPEQVQAPPENEPLPIEEITAEDPNRLLTDAERNSILAILKGKATGEADTLKVSKDARQFFMTKGAASTKQLTYKDLASCLEWANNYKV